MIRYTYRDQIPIRSAKASGVSNVARRFPAGLGVPSSICWRPDTASLANWYPFDFFIPRTTRASQMPPIDCAASVPITSGDGCEAMNLRHAALTLVIWHLMVPPPNYVGIPMANCERRAVFDSKARCESVATPPVRRLFGGGTIPWTITNPDPDYEPYGNFPKCASSEDPRLAK